MMGLEAPVALAHRVEDLLGALRDERLPVRRDLVDVLLAGFLRGFPRESGGVRRADPALRRSVADSEERFPQLASLLDQAPEAGGWDLVEEVLTMVIDVLIPALRSR
jgi:chemotaxis protein histidine kinase CheA